MTTMKYEDVVLLYLERYYVHRERGDDPMNARLRLLEEGATEEESLAVQDAAGENDDA